MQRKPWLPWFEVRGRRPLAVHAIAKTGTWSIRADFGKHVRTGQSCVWTQGPTERCAGLAPSIVQSITFMREPRAHVYSQWRHCVENQDNHFSPIGLPGSLVEWLQHWDTVGDGPRHTAVMTSIGEWAEAVSLAHAFRCYIPINLQSRCLSCAHNGTAPRGAADRMIPAPSRFLSLTTPGLDVRVLGDVWREFQADGELALRRVRSRGPDGLLFVGITELYQESMCLLHARELGELPPECDCQKPKLWARFRQNHSFVHHPTRGLARQACRVNATRTPVQLTAREVQLIDRVTRLDKAVYAAALQRLKADAAWAEKRFGVRVICQAKLDELDSVARRRLVFDTNRTEVCNSRQKPKATPSAPRRPGPPSRRSALSRPGARAGNKSTGKPGRRRPP